MNVPIQCLFSVIFGTKKPSRAEAREVKKEGYWRNLQCLKICCSHLYTTRLMCRVDISCFSARRSKVNPSISRDFIMHRSRSECIHSSISSDSSLLDMSSIFTLSPYGLRLTSFFPVFLVDLRRLTTVTLAISYITVISYIIGIAASLGRYLIAFNNVKL